MQKLEPIAANLWIANGPTVSFLGFPYSTRMAVVQLGDDSLWVWSPIALSDGLKADLASVGQVRFLVSPNKLHHLFLEPWCAEFPDAQLYAPPGLAKKRPKLPFTAELTDTPPPSWAAEIDQVVVRGSLFMEEVLFFHRASETCLVGDLIQRFDPAELSRWQRWIMSADGLVGEKGSTPREWRLSFVDRKAARAAVKKALAWKPERLVIAHGTWVRAQGTSALREALAWLGV
jgi:hypothetical protein